MNKGVAGHGEDISHDFDIGFLRPDFQRLLMVPECQGASGGIVCEGH